MARRNRTRSAVESGSTGEERPTAPPAVVERRLAHLKVRLRIRLEPLPGGRVRVLEYHRKREGDTRWRRNRTHEGSIYPFAQLGLSESFEEVFPQANLFVAAG